MKTGCYTALATPFTADGVDYESLERLVQFQLAGGITGILAVGTTGESPTLTWKEHNRVIETVAGKTRGKCLCIAGTGSNNTHEALAASRHAAEVGVDAVLLVDPYYNGPSSLEIRREYVEPVARAVPSLSVIPYVIPGRTGAQLLAEDLAIAAKTCPNINTVKEATGSLDNMRRTRVCCGPDFVILSGDDALTYDMMTDPRIRAAGVISVMTNVAPAAVAEMVRLIADGKPEEARILKSALSPLFGLVTVKTTEQTPSGEVACRARNPLALKAMMTILGMPSGGCRRPLGKMTKKGLDVVLSALRQVQADNPEILAPVADFFNVDIAARLEDPSVLTGLCYEGY
ncbi:MAG: 4-hydroxy-tetrahydrodipicolinate synthase [Desulfobacterales bacterium]|nr:4-hydroxy-tetrahydrodipicolinate synthase [Desulfobacterales bacterium]